MVIPVDLQLCNLVSVYRLQIEVQKSLRGLQADRPSRRREGTLCYRKSTIIFCTSIWNLQVGGSVSVRVSQNLGSTISHIPCRDTRSVRPQPQTAPSQISDCSGTRAHRPCVPTQRTALSVLIEVLKPSVKAPQERKNSRVGRSPVVKGAPRPT